MAAQLDDPLPASGERMGVCRAAHFRYL